ncbi:hypothetical protein COX86_03600 [Candidatus Micrarchaeota archaeon CG_4_10_14_0_2_um_filter_60_11]|nr:MAG: hypothetical protein AUJ16_03085 [Candidatus Micrarchaeota archaeon CG1_02_60_51]PIN96423.1 MAG: hypothetical protein COU39_01230 [Candidatus Micrarchaeota archaeon CG10_big_fil_rev_8_21_14_0_10_60_32]PIO02364.1 MAG: hypothetical protein COT58_00620 [Candidatus Micrarchaeota archaeon CG09_land_8_20_14_0_10_60_16]PIY91928.1 MAG: hypothetical protein COY71_00485 [Candidatus Micrarchaeota archaeon CG_4_10_14_0_8_um_filter_60_7]PIZ90714.1 MAG: hypothetical protein COX86_03600 [Candidatus Mi
MKIAFMGGSYDPPHYGHLIAAQQILGSGYGEVWLAPCAANEFKKIIATPAQRMQMTRLAVKGLPGIVASDYDLKRNPSGDTVQTARLLKADGIRADFVVGSDLVPQMRRWPRAPELFKEAKFLVFPRLPHESKPRLPNANFRFYPRAATVTSLNSTEVRQRVKKGKTIAHLMPNAVAEFIRKNKIYQ